MYIECHIIEKEVYCEITDPGKSTARLKKTLFLLLLSGFHLGVQWTNTQSKMHYSYG